MPDIGKRVFHNIAVISGHDENTITNVSRLLEDLDMSLDLRGALQPGFERIARETNPSARIATGECEALVTAGKAVELVTERSKAKGGQPNVP